MIKWGNLQQNKMKHQTLDESILETHRNFGVIYQALAEIPDLRKKLPPKVVADFFKQYASQLAREKLGLKRQLTMDEKARYSEYAYLADNLENQKSYPDFYPAVRLRSGVNLDSEVLGYFKEDFKKIGGGIDIICSMTGAFIDAVITSEYLKNIGIDIDMILLYSPKRPDYKEHIQIFDSEKADMRKEFPSLIVEDSIPTTETIERLGRYLREQGYKQIYAFSPQTHKFSSDNLEIVKSELEQEAMEELDNYLAAQLLRFIPR